jgi:hypothetical protein
MMRLLFVVVASLSLAACASGAKPGAMAVQVAQSTMIDAESGLTKAIAVPTVTGGKKTNPLWMSKVSSEDFAESLRQSLAATTMLATDSPRFSLSAELLQLKQPFIGASLTVTSTVKYTLVDAASSKMVWSKEITTPYTAKFSDSYLAFKRLKLANEGSIKANIQELIQQLIAESKTNPDMAKAAKPIAMQLRQDRAG